MFLTQEELQLIYKCLPNGALKDKIASQITVNKDIIEDIITNFPDVASIWKSVNSSVYYAKFYINEDCNDTSDKIEVVINIENKYNSNTEIHIFEVEEEFKNTDKDWMYSGCELVWENKEKL